MHTSLTHGLAHSVLLAASLLANPVYSSASNGSAVDLFTTADGTTYGYSFTPAQGENATYLLIHGYPSSHKDWEDQIAGLTAEGFGVLAPDMLGFGASDMPTEVTEYRGKRLAGHYAELLDHAGVESAIGVGHDWGAGMLSHVAAYHQDRFDGFVFVSVPYMAPGGFFDLDFINAMGQAAYGYMTYGYWYFFNRHDAGDVIRDHLESHWHLMFPQNHTVWETDLAPVGGARAWLQADTITEEASFMDEEYKAEWMDWMSRPNGTEAGLNYYRAVLQGVNIADEAELTEEDWMLHVPVLTIGGAFDAVARPENLAAVEAWAAAGFHSEVLNGGHWLPKEVPEDLNRVLIQFGRRSSC